MFLHFHHMLHLPRITQRLLSGILNDAKCSEFKKIKQAKMDEDRDACAFLEVGRPLTRPRPATRPACSGARPASHPALAGSQAGWLGCQPGLTPGSGRFPGRRAWELNHTGGVRPRLSFTSSPPRLSPPWLPSSQTRAPPPSPPCEPQPTPSPPQIGERITRSLILST